MPSRRMPALVAAAALAAALSAGCAAPVTGSGRPLDDNFIDTPAIDPSAAVAAPLQDVVQTEWGPLTAADRDLLVKVRLAGLWEIPTGRQAVRRAARPATRRNLGEIAQQHVELDALVRRTASRLNVPLPNEPTGEQQNWMAEISAKSGSDYDRTAVLRLRQAHGSVYPLIAAVRGSTRNTLVRDFAQRSERFVAGHMALLESTGLVDEQALPAPPTVDGAPTPLPPGELAPSAPPATAVPSPSATPAGP